MELFHTTKQKIKFKQLDRDRGTHSAKGVSLDLSDDPKGERRSPAVEEVSTERDGDLPTDMIRFEEHSEEEYRDTGEDDDDDSWNDKPKKKKRRKMAKQNALYTLRCSSSLI